MKAAIITGNKSKQNFEIGEIVGIVSKHKGYYMCKGQGMAHYCVPFNELQILGNYGIS